MSALHCALCVRRTSRSEEEEEEQPTLTCTRASDRPSRWLSSSRMKASGYSTWSLNRCTGQWLPSVMSCRLVSGLPSSRALVKPLSKTSRYVILSLVLSLVF
ncbi:hypothetical protein EYF80_063539 [Liparis tanakae]|uniref:Uncharacterized protein n=1 Tax=Liparis tanakae TaxID=230148 RepID=A0A4Z2EC74_9TELE|nr:hypothetical protein EYF80_063539 [Liparis tanakae]